jgi:glycosyltransferase involved in cell wall biosynthesis
MQQQPNSRDPQPLRLVLTMPYFFPAVQFGGPVNQAYAVCQRLLGRGHRVQVVTTDMGISPDTPRDRWVDVAGCQVWYGRTRFWNRTVPYFEPQLTPALDAALAQADVLQLRMGFTLLNDLARRVAGRHDVPYVYNPEGAFSPVHLRTKRIAKWLFLRLIERRVLGDAAALQALTELDREHLIGQGVAAARIHVMPNGVAMVEGTGKPEALQFRQRWGIPEAAKVVFYLGRIARGKGLDTLLKVVAQVATRVPATMLVVAGPDEGQFPSLQRQATKLQVLNRLRFIGEIRGREKEAGFAASDVFALTSHAEGLPIAVLEACAHGLPVLITDRCNVPQVAQYRAGAVCALEVGQLSEALRQILTDDALRSDCGHNARRMVAECFSLERVVDLMEGLYTELAGRRT